MHVIGSVDAVIATTRAEAEGEIERLRAHSGEEIAALEAAPPEDDHSERVQRLTVARKLSEERAAQTEWEERRRVLELREAWIGRVVVRGNELLRSKSDNERREFLERLAREAVARVGGESIEISFCARDREIVDDAWCRAIDPRLTIGRDVPIRGGCVVRSGALVFDNSLEERAKRLEPVWRNALAGMYRL